MAKYPRCRFHPKYKGIQKPRISCAGCWWMWFWHGKNVDDQIIDCIQEDP
jgi:hypothetical protein